MKHYSWSNNGLLEAMLTWLVMMWHLECHPTWHANVPVWFNDVALMTWLSRYLVVCRSVWCGMGDEPSQTLDLLEWFKMNDLSFYWLFLIRWNGIIWMIDADHQMYWLNLIIVSCSYDVIDMHSTLYTQTFFKIRKKKKER